MNKTPVHLFQVPNIGNLLYNEDGDFEDMEISQNRRKIPSDSHVYSHVEQSRPNSRPPVQHTFRNKSNSAIGSESRPSTVASDGRSRPVSASALDYSIQENLQATNTVDDLITVVKGKLDKDFEQEIKKKKKKKLIITILVVALTVMLISVVLGSVLSTALSAKSSKKEDYQDASTGTTSTATSSVEIGSTPIPQTTPSPHPVLVIDDNYNNVTYGGTWLDWSAWTECSRSCSAGTQSRNRTCGSEELLCLGASIQHMRCNTALCPISEPEALWSTWNSWEDCSVSCGTGAQIRRRICTELETTRSVLSENCVGTDELARPCNMFPCPDCSTRCDTGTLDTTCTYCYCMQSIIGQIVSDSRLPLDNVTITPANAPYNTLATSTVGGFFVINNACVEQSFSFHKHGYITFTGTLNNEFENVTMTQTVSLQVVQNPRDKMVITGDSVTFCCGVHGIPEPDYYEWMKNGDVLPNNNYITSTTLELENVNPDDTGYYQCRASNEYGAIYSAIATLMVEDNYSAYCSQIPSSLVISLPEGCTINNETTIDKGICEGNLCYSGNSDGCDSEARYYCSPSGFQIVNSDCGEYTLPVFLVTSCRCQLWQEDELTIYGFAGLRDSQPLQYGNIYWNGSIICNTSADGTFSFRITRGTSRSSLLFIDVYNRTFMDTTYIFYFPSDSESSLFLRVYLMRIGIAYSVNASEPSYITMNGTTIDIPADSFYTQDGEIYVGTVTASFCTINSSNIEDLTSAPGDLTIIDEEGESQQLLSYGMFAMSFEDENGNQLSIPGEITISLPMSALGDENNTATEIRVWTLNPSTGVWEYASNLVSSEPSSRSKRQIEQGIWGQDTFSAVLRGININVRWFNFDAISTQTCIVKVRLYENNRYSEYQQINNGQVYVVTQDSSNYNSLSTQRVSTDTGSNGYCMVIPCKSHRNQNSPMFRGYILAESGNTDMIPESSPEFGGLGASSVNLASSLNYLIAEDNKIQVNFDENLVFDEGNGPFYDYESKWRYSSNCSNATATSNHFRFFKLSTCMGGYNIFGDYSTLGDDGQIIRDVHFEIDVNLLLWHDITSYFTYNFTYSPITRAVWAFKKCFMKIKAPRGLVVEATSFVADPNHHFFHFEPHVYGMRNDCMVDDSVCLEIRPPQRPRKGASSDNGAVDNETQTRIQVVVRDSDPLELTINEQLLQNYQSSVLGMTSENTFEMYMIDERSLDSYGSQYGIYCKTGNTKDEAQLALQRCRNGNDNVEAPRGDTSTENWAIEFAYPPPPTVAPIDGAFPISLSQGSYGILQVYYNNEWGTVCDHNYWNTCEVACRQLGYLHGVQIYCGEGTGPILLHGFFCMGSERSVDECSFGLNPPGHCYHNEDTACRCCNTNDYCDYLFTC